MGGEPNSGHGGGDGRGDDGSTGGGSVEVERVVEVAVVVTGRVVAMVSVGEG